MAEFVVPDFISGRDVNTIHSEMRKNLPADIDTSEGSHPWNLTFPHAYELAYSTEYVLSRAIQLIWPEFAWGEWLDYHAKTRGLGRIEATYAIGEITVKGEIGTEIPEGSIFSTQGTDTEEAVSFQTTAKDIVIQDAEGVTIPVAAQVAGKKGNVPAHTIIITPKTISGITVTNKNPISGGIEAETDADLSQRIMEYDKAQDISFVGNSADYERWAKAEIGGEGIGVVVLDPEDSSDVTDEESGVVTLIITGIEDQTDEEKDRICARVYNKIMNPTPDSQNGKRPDGEVTGPERLAPLNAKLIVQPASVRGITVNADVELIGTTDINMVKEEFMKVLKKYFLTALTEGEIKYSMVGMCLLQTTGIQDYSNLKLEKGEVNVPLDRDVFPIVTVNTVVLRDVDATHQENTPAGQ